MANIQKIAEELVRLSHAETYALTCLLAKEYGIKAESVTLKQDIPSETERVFTLKNVEDILREEVIIREAERKAEKRQWFVPRVIGKPCKGKLPRRK